MLNRLITVLLVVVCALPAVAQDVDTAWVRIYNGTGDNSDYAYAIAIDAIGNVCVTGQSWGGASGYDYATVKYYPDGDTAWVRRYSHGVGNGSDVAVAVAIDGDNRVCVTGSSWNGTNSDYVTIKYDSGGTQLWLATLDRWQDNARDIAADNSGNVYVTGFSSATPIAPTDFITVKYEPDGDTAWVRAFDGPANGDDSASAIVVDNSGNVYVTGQCKLTSSPYTLRGFGTIKYDPAGNFVWARFLSPPPNCNDYPLDMAVDDSDNVYVTGRGNGIGFDYLAVKYASDGTQLWVKTYNGPGNGSDFATGIAVDGYGNVYVTGQSVATSLDYATIKYDPEGNQLWVRRYDGGYTDDFATSIAVDDPGNVYITGGSIGDGTGFDYTTIKYDPDSTQIWVQRYNGTGNRDDNANAVAVDEFGHVYVTGSCDLGFNAGDYGTMKYWQNYAPISFSLLSPEDSAVLPPGVVGLDWENAADPDPWDTVWYDLYVSSSMVFHPDSTIVYDSLLSSEYSDDFDIGTYYWKVRAYDDRAETWSSQTWTFVVASPTGLVGYWKFDEGEGDIAYDASGYGNDGTLMNEPTWVDGLPLLNKALQFDGIDDYVAVPDASSLDMTGPFTIMAWIRPDALPAGTGDAEIASFINKWMNYILQTGEQSPHKPGRLRIVAQNSEGNWYALESDSVLVVNRWQHIVGLWDGDNLKLFHNGLEIASLHIPSFTPGPYLQEGLYIGTEKAFWQFFDGLIDEVKIYSRALSPEEIQDEFESGFIRGDANADGIVNVGDVVYLVSYLYKNGPTPNPSDAGDCNCDGIVNLGDVVYLVSYLYKNGPPPSC